MTGGYKTEITGIVLDECQWSENTSDHGLVMKLSLKKNPEHSHVIKKKVYVWTASFWEMSGVFPCCSIVLSQN